MNKKLILALFLLVSLLSFKSIAQAGQREVTVTGKVIDKETNQPLEYATIAFFSKQENKIVTGGITDTSGNFSIPVPSGTYDISIEFISFKKITLPNKSITESQNIGSFSLEIDAEALGAVEVVAERTTVEMKLDKRIYNVGQDLTVRGGTVSDVLDNVPSVSVDVDGNVALRGNQNVTILINGKPSGLVGLNSTDALRQLPADAIERVEVITAPSSRYDAEGTGGILNIILRRSKLQGMNGAVTLNAGTPTNYGASGNINYRTGNFNFFNTSSYNYRENPGKGLSERDIFNGNQPDTYLNEYRTSDRTQDGFTISNGVEWYVNDSASLTASVVIRNSDNESEISNESFQLNENNTITRRLRLTPERENDKTFQYALNFDKQFGDNSQHKLTADFQYENSAEDEFSNISNDGDPSQRVQTLEDQRRILLQTDYVLPIGEGSQFEAGYRGNFNVMNTDYRLEDYKTAPINDYVVNTKLTNNLIYTEHVNAVYSQYGSKLNKFSYLLGLRLEETRITVDQVTTGDFGKNNYLGLFPTLNLSYELSEKQSLTLGYNRRISRPRSRFINPFPSQSSPTTQFIGNPNLSPSYSNTVDVGYLNNFGKLTLNSSLYYSKATETFEFIQQGTGDYYIPELDITVNENDPTFPNLASQYNEVEVFQSTPINLASNARIGFEFTLTYRPTTKWNLNGNFNVFQSQNRGEFNGTSFDNDNVTWFARINNKYTLPGNIDWQTRVFYQGPSQNFQTQTRGMASVDLAFSKDVFDNNMSIAFNISDLFNSRKRISETNTENSYIYSENQWRQRSFNVSLTYRFNQQKRQQNRERGEGQGQGPDGGEGGFEDMQFE